MAVTVAVPSQPGAQLGSVDAVTAITGEAGAFSKTVVVAEQLFASVTVIVYVVPAHSALVAPVAALIVPPGAIVNTLLPLPPAVVIVAVPSQPGLQLGFVVVFTDKVKGAGWLIVNETVPTQLLPSVADTV